MAKATISYVPPHLANMSPFIHYEMASMFSLPNIQSVIAVNHIPLLSKNPQSTTLIFYHDLPDPSSLECIHDFIQFLVNQNHYQLAILVVLGNGYSGSRVGNYVQSLNYSSVRYVLVNPQEIERNDNDSREWAVDESDYDSRVFDFGLDFTSPSPAPQPSREVVERSILTKVLHDINSRGMNAKTAQQMIQSVDKSKNVELLDTIREKIMLLNVEDYKMEYPEEEEVDDKYLLKIEDFMEDDVDDECSVVERMY
eukprot:TRINITY_DN4290_c0_g1_i4.p1 TRINITY_DN4290_c0_g1~~TRINITY_DN4290_c0_g1_i4.p1  ORF type:complete len:254 (+),score=31.10 TRINITY_DN4290_c0_g1_i4:32-793(+)